MCRITRRIANIEDLIFDGKSPDAAHGTTNESLDSLWKGQLQYLASSASSECTGSILETKRLYHHDTADGGNFAPPMVPKLLWFLRL